MKIMFICTGNICRSAMADGLLKKRLKDLDKKDMEVYSCGVFAEDGDEPTYNAIEAMKYYDVNLKTHKATNIQNSNIEEMDLILCMTQSHKNSVLNMYPKLKDKIFTLKEYVKYKESAQDIDVQDPWGYDMQTYKKCAEEISICIELLLQKFYKLY